VVALDVGAAERARLQRAMQERVLLDGDDAKAAIGQRARDGAAAGAWLHDERARGLVEARGEIIGERGRAQEVLRAGGRRR
jgi:hypothetical protein